MSAWTRTNRWWRCAATVACVLALSTHAYAGPPWPEKPAPSESQQIAREVQKAMAAADGSLLPPLSSGVDPWLVVDALLAMRAQDAAAAYITQAPANSLEALRRYVARGPKTDPKTRRILALVRERLAAREALEACEVAERIATDVSTLVGIRLAHAHSVALEHNGDGLMAAQTAGVAARAALQIGWTRRARPLLRLAARASEEPELRREALRGLLEVAVLDEDLAQQAKATLALGLVARRLNQPKVALQHFEDGVALAIAAKRMRIEVQGLLAIAAAQREERKLEDALTAVDRAIARLRKGPLPPSELGLAHEERAEVLALQRQWPEAAKAYETSAFMFACGMGRDPGASASRCLRRLGLMQRHRGKLTAPLDCLTRAWAYAERTESIDEQLLVLTSRADVHARLGHAAQARADLQRAHALR